MAGLDGLAAWWEDTAAVPPEPEAQGPALGDDGAMRATGPFRVSRHPLNLAPVPVLWLQPRMTANRLASNVAATVYCVLGSVHEEARLRAAYGPAYWAYQRSGVPFLLPRWGRPIRRSVGAGAHACPHQSSNWTSRS